MFNYQSKKKVSLSNPIVFSFDLKDTRNNDDFKCEQLNFGLSSDRAKTTVDQSIHIFKNSIFHKNNIIDEVSCVKNKDSSTLLSNCGDKIFNKNYIFLTSYIEDLTSYIEDDNSENFKYELYIQNDNPSENDSKISLNDLYYTKITEDKLKVIPQIMWGQVFEDDITYSDSDSEYILTFSDDINDEYVICSDYIFEIKDKTYSTVLVMNDDEIESMYYTDIFPESDCRIRCIITNKGRNFSLSTSDVGTNNYKKQFSIMRSNYTFDEAFVRFSVLGDKNNTSQAPISNITSNF